jgi:hypothetical protein
MYFILGYFSMNLDTSVGHEQIITCKFYCPRNKHDNIVKNVYDSKHKDIVLLLGFQKGRDIKAS